MIGSHLEEQAEKRAPCLMLVALMAVASLLDAIGFNRDLWLDEIYTLVRVVRHPIRGIITNYQGDNQHMFYSVLARISVVLFGEHPWTVRLPAVVFGVCAVPALYFLAREVTTRREALLATTLLTVSYHLLWFSQDARGYTGMLFLTLVCTIYLLRGLRSAKWSNWLIYAVAASLGAYMYLMVVFVVLAHAAICAWLLLFPAKNGDCRVRDWKQPAAAMALAGLLTLLLYAPVLLQLQQNFLHQPSKMQAISTPHWAFWETLRGLQIGFGSAAAVAVAGALFAAGLWSYFRQSRVAAAVFVLPGLGTAAGAFAARGTMYPRFYFYLLGFAMLIVVRGAMAAGAVSARKLGHGTDTAMQGVKWGTALVVLMILVSAISLTKDYQYPKQDFSGAMRFVVTRPQADEPVVTTGVIGYVYEQYYGLSWVQVDSAAQLDAIRAQGHRVWMVYTFPLYVERETPDLMATIRRDCPAKRVFPGTVGGGDVTVCTLEAYSDHKN
jgi:hypothetical protein